MCVRHMLFVPCANRLYPDPLLGPLLIQQNGASEGLRGPWAAEHPVLNSAVSATTDLYLSPDLQDLHLLGSLVPGFSDLVAVTPYKWGLEGLAPLIQGDQGGRASAQGLRLLFGCWSPHCLVTQMPLSMLRVLSF
jgi:hypothetical protein